MWPSDALTKYWELQGAGTYTLVSGTSPKTVIGVSIQQSATNSQSDIKCGSSDVFVRNYGKDFPFNQVMKICDDNIIVEKTGNDSASFIVTYVPRHYTEATIKTTPDIPTMEAMNGFSYLIFFGFGLIVLILGIQTGFMFMRK